MKTKILTALTICLGLIFSAVQIGYAQDSTYAVHLRRDFGYGMGSDIQGTFTIRLLGDEEQVDRVTFFIDDEVLFDNWTGGRVNGKENLRKAWTSWFNNHGGFRFTEEELFIDEAGQKVLYRWRLDWPSLEVGYEGRPEVRRGVDVMHFQDGKIIQKLTYSKTTVEIDGERVRLTAQKNG